MTYAVAGLIARAKPGIQDADCVDISFPSFWTDFEGCASRDETAPGHRRGRPQWGREILRRPGLARALRYRHIDTGAMYRATGLGRLEVRTPWRTRTPC